MGHKSKASLGYRENQHSGRHSEMVSQKKVKELRGAAGNVSKLLKQYAVHMDVTQQEKVEAGESQVLGSPDNGDPLYPL